MHLNYKTLAQKSKNAIEVIHIAMLHLFNRGYYEPMGLSGATLRNALLDLEPEIYGSLANPKQVELNGLIYVLDRLPEGIESCKYINLMANEGLSNTHFQKIIPLKRRRNCFRIDDEQINIEITRGKSDVYDLLTHLTFLCLESHKLIGQMFVGGNQELSHEWIVLESYVLQQKEIQTDQLEVLFVYLASLLGRTYHEVAATYEKLATETNPHKLLQVIYWLGTLAAKEAKLEHYRLVRFSDTLKEEIGSHKYANLWALQIKDYLYHHHLIDRPIHIISANMHSVKNVIYAPFALKEKGVSGFDLYDLLGDDNNLTERNVVTNYAMENGLVPLNDVTGTNIDVQIIDAAKFSPEITNHFKITAIHHLPIIIVMDYAFGEQAYETMDELLKPYLDEKRQKHFLNVQTIAIMGKAGILVGDKGDIMIPKAHIMEGTADNYFFTNELTVNDFKNLNLKTFTGNMITVLGTSLQNKYILKYFRDASWNGIGLEMEGAHYQKAIQIASQIRNHIVANVKVSYAYYASDNPLFTGSTLASGGLGTKGVLPTYAITEVIVNNIFNE